MYAEALKVLILESLLLAVCFLGDHLLHHPVAKQQVFVAAIDSLTHGLVGGVSWCIVCNVQLTKLDVCECIACLILAMVVDLDHFIAAQSFNLKAALSLPSRPPFHATTLIVAVDAIFLVLSVIFKTTHFQMFGMIFTVAWLSHHVRDATRRGLWFYPFGSTRPLSRGVYLGIVMALPLTMRVIYNFWRKQRLKQTISEELFV